MEWVKGQDHQEIQWGKNPQLTFQNVILPLCGHRLALEGYTCLNC